VRRAARTDANHQEIVAALRRAGIAVKSLAAVGKGMPDLLVAFRGVNVLLEVKDGSKPESERQLTADEQDFFDTWPGPRFIVTRPEEAVLVVYEAARPKKAA